jgi:hypothetical protein
MRAAISTLAATALLAGLWAMPAPASAAECEPPVPTFGFCEVKMSFTDGEGAPATQAGSHPFAQTTTINPFLEVVPGLGKVPSGQPREFRLSLPPGFVGSPDATPQCDSAHFLTARNFAGGAALLPDCPDSSAVGVARPRGAAVGGAEVRLATPVYNLVPPPGVAARLGFQVPTTGSVQVDINLNESPPYNLVAITRDITQVNRFYGIDVTLWANPGASSHDNDRGLCGAEFSPETGKVNDLGDFLGITCATSIPPLAFFTLPRSCQGPLTTIFEADSWGNAHALASAQSPAMTGCERVGFGPRISSVPTDRAASSPTGLDFDLDITDERLTDPGEEAIADSDIKEAVVTLPEGVTVNPSQAEGLTTCSEADFARERSDSAFGAGCPAASKIGTVEAESPLLKGVVLRGSVFVATPYENLASDSLIALYFTLKEPERGLNVALIGRVAPDPRTGQLVTTVGAAPYEIPQLPASHFHFHFREGGRSPLITPPRCGTYQTKAVFTPWANPQSPLTTTASFTIDHGVGGGPCPSAGTPPFEPGFEAGSVSNQAGHYSPFQMRLTRRDGDQDLTKLSAVLPLGMLARLAGVDKCPDAQIALAKQKSGKAELASPSCPANSLIGTATGGAGAGSQLTYVSGRLYLAGPYNGAPLSVVAIVPAVAGPFDVGTIVTRFALDVNPRSGEVTVDGSRSDPIPHILEGIPLAVRDVRASVNRSGFTLNPTSCDPAKVGATIWGGGADPFGVADDMPVQRQARFQAAGCAALGFKPKLALKLRGGTRRGAHPKLHAVFTPREGDANLEGLSVRLPHSAFLDQAHIRTICTRVQFAAKSCPQAAIYGHVRATTPLLSEPLEGPVYLRSSNHNLPDLVLVLHGIVDFEAVARIDSVRGGIRATFTGIPDAPVTQAVVDMQGAKKGLIVNSTDLCAKAHRADVRMGAHNGDRYTVHPRVAAGGCG